MKLDAIKYDFTKTAITFITPVGYLEMVYLLKNCQLVMCDSGGLQKEAFFFKKRCIILRNETEWVELVENRFNFLAGVKSKDIVKCYNDVASIKEGDFSKKLYGDGMAGVQILEKLLD